MWTATDSQDILTSFDLTACVHSSGLFLRPHMNAGQMVSQHRVPNIKAASRGNWESRGILYPGSIDHTVPDTVVTHKDPASHLRSYDHVLRPAPFMAAARRISAELGVLEERYIEKRFDAAVIEDAPPAFVHAVEEQCFTVMFAKPNRSIDVRPDQTVLLSAKRPAPKSRPPVQTHFAAPVKPN
jgi:hypothetical protein